MIKYLSTIIILFLLVGCRKNPDVLYQSKDFTIYADKVVQGDFEARAVSRTNLESNYVSQASANYSNLITFKFSINEKDNEMISGDDHWLLIDGENVSPIIKFGKSDGPAPKDNGTKLSADYKYTFRLDMRDVLNQLKNKGYYEAFDESKVAAADFKGVYIAGGSEPLTWDFSNLDENKLELKDEDQDGIYEITLMLNPYNTEDHRLKEWNLTSNITAKPAYHSDQILVDALYNMALEEAVLNIEPDSTLRTGAKWSGVWTRDVSYSTLLAFAFHEPEIAKISLKKKVKRDRIIQDTGSGGAWPVSSDRTTWALAAWEIYKVTGDRDWLEYAFIVIKNTLEDDRKTLRSEKTGMYKGESSFLDWREQTYPKWMSNMDIFVSENLGTNVVHYQAHIILAEMATLLGQPNQKYLESAKEIKDGINQFLWKADNGFYAQYLYSRYFLMPSERFETLGESLAILFQVADEQQSSSIISKSPVTAFGTTCIYPQIPGIPPYHNNAVWPFVQAFWNLASAKVGDEKALEHGLACIYRPAALFLSNYENFVAENGDYVGTEINSHRMLWSMAGNLAMVYRVFIGINFEVDGIRFNPVIPKLFGGEKKLSNFKYRDATFDITVVGFGNKIASIKMDGKPLDEAFIPAEIQGKHVIEIQMDNHSFSSGAKNLQKNRFSLPQPQATLKNSVISWDPIAEADSYKVYRNGEFLESVTASFCKIDNESYSEYSVSAVDADGYESFVSEPISVYNPGDERILELEDFITPSKLSYTNYSGVGFIETSLSKNTEIEIPIEVEKAGNYLIDFRYSNGTGPWNTDNNCAIRSLYVNDAYKGIQVFPQRGTDEWSDWGWSNSKEIRLEKGRNTIKLAFEEWNTNMDGEINTAMLDCLKLVRLR